MSRSPLFVLLALVLAVHAAPAPMTFQAYVEKYNKNYDPNEYMLREEIFLARLEIIRSHNEKGLSHTYGINHMTDWKEEEFTTLFGFDHPMYAYRKSLASPHRLSAPIRARNTSLVADRINWVEQNATTPVKDQGACGSCWAFAGVESVESDIFIETGKLLVLSPQFYVDCVSNTGDCGGTGGCAGATPDILFEYAIKNGARLETDYPYRANESYCLAGRTNNVATINGWVDVLQNDYDALMLAVNKQPVTIGVAANSWPLYSGGVVKFDSCDADIDHAVLLVGYGTDPVHGDYWLVQNSWGPGWGEKGFIRLERNASDSTRCRSDAKPADGFGCKGHDEPVLVCGTCGILYAPSYPVGGKVL